MRNLCLQPQKVSNHWQANTPEQFLVTLATCESESESGVCGMKQCYIHINYTIHISITLRVCVFGIVNYYKIYWKKVNSILCTTTQLLRLRIESDHYMLTHTHMV